MIEVEKKFQPSQAQLKAILADAEFLREEVLEDIYYDFPDYRLFKNDIRLRKRNGVFELKLGKSSGVAQEIENKKEIEKYLGTEKDLEEFIKNNLILIISYKTVRQKYKKGEFIIDIDKTSFGYELCEIELLVEREEEIKNANEKILNLAKQYNFEIKKLLSKRAEYFRIKKPELFKKFYE